MGVQDDCDIIYIESASKYSAIQDMYSNESAQFYKQKPGCIKSIYNIQWYKIVLADTAKLIQITHT